MIVFDDRFEDDMKDNADKRVGNRSGNDEEHRREDHVDAHGFHGHAGDHRRARTGQKQRIFLKGDLFAHHLPPASVLTISVAPKTIPIPSTQ